MNDIESYELNNYASLKFFCRKNKKKKRLIQTFKQKKAIHMSVDIPIIFQANQNNAQLQVSSWKSSLINLK